MKKSNQPLSSYIRTPGPPYSFRQRKNEAWGAVGMLLGILFTIGGLTFIFALPILAISYEMSRDDLSVKDAKAMSFDELLQIDDDKLSWGAYHNRNTRYWDNAYKVYDDWSYEIGNIVKPICNYKHAKVIKRS